MSKNLRYARRRVRYRSQKMPTWKKVVVGTHRGREGGEGASRYRGQGGRDKGRDERRGSFRHLSVRDDRRG